LPNIFEQGKIVQRLMMTFTRREAPEALPASARRAGQALPLALLALLAAFHLTNNWLWRAANEVIFGADRMYHLVSSLAYYDILKAGVNPASLFDALTLSGYYPPLVHLTVTVSYALFGVSTSCSFCWRSMASASGWRGRGLGWRPPPWPLCSPSSLP